MRSLCVIGCAAYGSAGKCKIRLKLSQLGCSWGLAELGNTKGNSINNCSEGGIEGRKKSQECSEFLNFWICDHNIPKLKTKTFMDHIAVMIDIRSHLVLFSS